MTDRASAEGLLDRIREETLQAVIEGDAQDCSSPDCIADAVYEIVRVALRSESDSGLDALADDVRYAGGNGTSDYWRGFNDGIDALVARLSTPRTETSE